MLTKPQACYQYQPETQYRCQECTFIKSVGPKAFCAFFGPTSPISAQHGGCNYFTTIPGHMEVPWLNAFTPDQLGYVENGPGFSCKRCEEFLPPKTSKNNSLMGACKKVDGEISPDGCCNLWQRDPKRGDLPTQPLVQVSMPVLGRMKWPL